MLDLAIVAAIARIQWQPMVPIRQPLNARLAIRANGLGAPWVRGKPLLQQSKDPKDAKDWHKNCTKAYTRTGMAESFWSVPYIL